MTSSLFAHFFSSRWHRNMLTVLAMVASTTIISAQSLKPENNTDTLVGLPYDLSQMRDSGLVRLALLVNMTAMPPQEPIQTFLRWIDPQEPNEPVSDEISFITCDASAYADNVDPLDVVANSIDANVSAIVLYSTSSKYCNYSSDPRSESSSSYRSLYTVTSRVNGTSVENYIRNSGGSLEAVSVLQASDSELNFDEMSDGSSGTPSTAVAMTVLYSITAVITALFIAIIATGVIRAHRHPERYGPRNGEGQERRSRAKGIARAVLDTLPIVKFGGERGPSKPSDVEMVNQQRGSHQQREEGEEEVEETREAGRGEQECDHGHDAAAIIASAEGDGLISDRSRPSTEAVIHTNTSSQPRSPGDSNGATGFSGNTQHKADNVASSAGPAKERITEQQHTREPATDVAPSCSICTEDFAMGEDIRVLPCDHKFHPACVDPWLLNVSGTCPLCRIDLRPTSQASSTFPAGANALAAAEDPDAALSPPLDHQRQQEEPSGNTRRYSGLRTVFSLNYNRRRLQNAPPAERIAALQRMRTDSERAQRQQRQQQRQRWRLSQRSAVDNDTDAQGSAGPSGDGIGGSTLSNADANIGNNESGDDAVAAVAEEPNRRRNRMSVRLQEVFGVRTSRPESVIFAGVRGGEREGEGRGRGGNTLVATTDDLTETDGNIDTNTQVTTTSPANQYNTNTNTFENMTLPEAPRLPPINL